MSDELVEQPCADVDLHHAAVAVTGRPDVVRWTRGSVGGGGGPAADQATDYQIALVVDDGEPPFGTVLASNQPAGLLRIDRAPAGDLTGVLVQAEQRGQPDSHLHT